MKKTITAILCLAFCLTAISAIAFADETGYTVLVTDEGGEPVSGVMVQFCSDTECMMEKTGEDGIATFEKEAGSYTVHVLKTPDGYEKDESEYTMPEEPGILTIALKADGTKDNVTVEVPERGIRFTISQEYLDKGLVVESPNENVNGYPIISIYYYSPSYSRILDEILTLMDQEDFELTEEKYDEFTERLWATSRCLMDITLIEESEYKALAGEGGAPNGISYYSPAEVLTTNDGYVYLIAVPELDDGDLTSEEAADYHACREYMKTVRENLTYTSIEFEDMNAVPEGQVPAFQTVDLEGNTVTDGIFAEHELTIMNIWGTFCGPCIMEMPELGEWARSMDERVALVGIIGDVMGTEDEDTISDARKILSDANADFINLIPDGGILLMLESVNAFPTTIFVNSEGEIVGEAVVGADVDAYKEFVEEYFGNQAA